ncbi:branched-chain amino acid ABC transporter permease [Sinorhizobium meliloti]|uniref:branched-chain amino acid ABC transporter permease n=1 Tax=Rhizobium meliloti TaxID=382 RepID=UPI003F169608
MWMSVSYSVERATPASRIAMPAAFVLLAVLVAAPFFAGRAEMRLMVEVFYYLALAQMWSLLAGYGGLVSVGQQAFVGIGAYMLFTLAIFLGIQPVLAVVLAGVLTALVAVPTAFVAFRLRGAYFAIGTWVIAEVYRLGFAQVTALGGGSGMSLPVGILKTIGRDRAAIDSIIYWVALAIVVASILMVYLLLSSRWGLAMRAIRDSEPASESLGVHNYWTKFLVYVATAGMTGMIGAFIFLQKLRISPDAAFSVNDWTALVIFIVVIGGIGSIEGPIIGVIVYFILREIASDWGAWYLILLGAIAVATMLKARTGLWGLIAERYDLQLFPVGRRLSMKSQ